MEEYRPLLNNNHPSPPKPVIGQPKFSVIKGKAEIELNQWQSYQRNFDVKAQELSTIEIRTYYYPAWHLYINNQPHPIEMSEDGTIEITLQEGYYQVQLRYQWTWVFKVGIILSILSLILLSFYWFKFQLKSKIRTRN